MKRLSPIRLALAISAAVITCPQAAFPHARLLPGGTLPPRDTIAHKVNNSVPGTASDPGCVVARAGGQAITTLTPGSVLTVQWEEFIDHPGSYEVWFSPNANDSAMVKLPFIGGNPATAQDVVGNGNLPHLYSATITVPAVCNACALRLVQVMTEVPANPTYYYSCANVQITDGASPTASPSPSPAVAAPAGTLTIDCPDHPKK